jgi:TonB family protein
MKHNSRQRLDLPFVARRRDVGSVVYDHRAGIFALLIAALVVAVLFIGSKIEIYSPQPLNGILIDLRTLEELAAEKARLEAEVRRRQVFDNQGGPTRNAVSNENTELRDDHGGSSQSLQDQANAAQGRLDANRAAANRGQSEIDGIGKNRDQNSISKNSQSGDSRAKGRVLVSFSLASPTRFSDYLEIPGYRCEGGGEVVVVIVVNRSGTVVSASVDGSRSASDDCMHSTALTAARRSRFNIDNNAPERQTGTITYTFIPQ